MGRQLVSDEHRLRVLHVRPTRHNRSSCGPSLRQQRINEVKLHATNVAGFPTQVATDQGGYLVISGSTSSQPPPKFGAGTLQKAPLKSRVNVLILGARNEGSRRHVGV